MKPRRHPPARTVVRLKPGRLLRLPLRFLKQAGWRPGSVLLVQSENSKRLHRNRPCPSCAFVGSAAHGSNAPL